jgi:hypothetical protein
VSEMGQKVSGHANLDSLWTRIVLSLQPNPAPLRRQAR